MLDYCECGSIIINKECTNRGCIKTSIKRKSWKIGDDLIKFNKALTYNEAYKEYTENSATYRNARKEKDKINYYYK